MKLHHQSARSLARLIREKELSPVELYKSHREEIDKLNGTIRALRVVNERASSLAEIKASELNEGIIPGRLHGVCFCVKDNINVAGLPRSQGSVDSIVDRDETGAQLVELLEKEGGICIGKSNMAEYGKSYFTDNVPYGRTVNPFNHEHSPGGSSGGDAAAVAAGFASFGLASDAGGSIRVPANFCGLFGLHPTRGVYTEGGMAFSGHFISSLFRSPGIIARSADDVELLHSILARPDLRDPTSIATPPFYGLRRTKTFGWYSSLEHVECDDEIQGELERCISQFEKLGFTGRKISPTVMEKALHPFVILAGQAAFMLEDLLFLRAGHPRDHEKEGPMVKALRAKIATQLPPLTPETLLLALDDVQRLRREAVSLFDEVDFLLCPVAATSAPRHDATSFTIKGKHYEPHEVFRFSSAVNVLGLPAVAFPTGLSSTELPLGLQLIGPRFTEPFLLEVLRLAGFRSAVPLD